jgi:hypothetical protein
VQTLANYHHPHARLCFSEGKIHTNTPLAPT